MIDQHLEQLLDAMVSNGFCIADRLDAASLRAMLDTPLPAPPIEIAHRRDLSIVDGERRIGARLYHPAPGETLPAILFFHGGGWVHGTLDTHDRLAAALASGADCAVISVAYRLAPDHPFPAAWRDAVASLHWVHTHAPGLRIDAERIAVAGDSAGGNLAAAVAQAVAGGARIVHQLLFYPALDGRCATPSFATDHPGFLSGAQMRWYWEQYAPGEAKHDPRASPALASIDRALAPATIILAGNDPLHDEGVAYADALAKAGVRVALHDYPGAIHGFASFSGLAPVADEAVAVAAEALRAALRAR